jgi:hypothetical protein
MIKPQDDENKLVPKEATMTNDEMRAVTIRQQDELPVEMVVARARKVQELMKDCMTEGQHFGKIPGTDKPTLLKPGAEKLNFTFRLVATYPDIERLDLPNEHREYQILCRLLHQGTGQLIAEGVGSCSTMESKYRYRWANKKCPKCGAEAIIKGKAEYGGGWICYGKKGGCGAKYKDDAGEIVSQPAGKIENPDIADIYNTVFKMAKKRALVDATIAACAASDLFTQDMEDFVDESGIAGENEKPPVAEKPPAAAKKKTDSGRQPIIDKIVTVMQHPCFTDDERKALHEETKKCKTYADLNALLANKTQLMKDRQEDANEPGDLGLIGDENPTIPDDIF